MERLTRYQKLNRKKLIAYFKRAGKFSQTLGFELEHILLHDDGRPVSYAEPGGVRDVLERLSQTYQETFYEDGCIIGVARSHEVVSIEPAGQLEVSLGPFTTVTEIETAYLAFRNALDPILDEFGLQTPMLGYNPAACARDLELVPKFRYKCMTQFLGEQAYEGLCMMRGSASLQISIDYENETDAMRKMRIAEIISPILALICDNSPIYEGRERTANIVRTGIWSAMRHDRTCTVPESLKVGFSFADYADYIMTREAILAPAEDARGKEYGEDARIGRGERSKRSEQNAPAWRFVADATFDELYADREMSERDIEHALSMVWPDARLKSFVEIRPADAMPIEYCLAYAVLIRALFYSKRNLDVLDSLLASVDEGHIAQAKVVLAEKGYGAEIYGRSVEFWADLLVVLASGSLLPDEWIYLEPIASMVKYRFTLAEIWPRLMEKRNDMPAGSPVAPVIGVVPRYDFEWTGLAVSDGYLSGLLEAGAVPIVLPATADPAHIKRIVDMCDGFLVPGGQDIDPARYGERREPHTHRSATARDLMEQELIQAVIQADKPLLGICRGMQSLNVALGGTLHQDVSTKLSGKALQHIQGRPFDMPAHMVELTEGSLLATCVGATRLGVNTIHHQSVATLGEGLVVNAISPDDGIVEGIEMPGKRFIIGVQWHPEYMWRRRPHSKRLFRALVEAASASRE